MQRFKRALGPIAEQMSEKEIEQLRETQDKLAEAMFIDWQKNKNISIEAQPKKSYNSIRDAK